MVRNRFLLSKSHQIFTIFPISLILWFLWFRNFFFSVFFIISKQFHFLDKHRLKKKKKWQKCRQLSILASIGFNDQFYLFCHGYECFEYSIHNKFSSEIRIPLKNKKKKFKDKNPNEKTKKKNPNENLAGPVH